MDGLLRYNRIQSALSPVKKEKGWKLEVGGFQAIASKIYQHTKKQPLKQVINNIDVIVENLPKWETPFLPPELFEWTPFFNFDADAKSGNGIWNPELVSENLYVKSPQLFAEEDFIVDAAVLSYDDHFKRFSDYCNENRGYWWVDSLNAPLFRFTEPKFDWDQQRWLTYLELGQEDGYGYVPAEGPVVKKDVTIKPPKEIKPPVPPEEEKPSEKELEVKRLQAEAEKEKASLAKLQELNKAVDRLDSQLQRGLITKKQYKEFLKRLYEF